MGILDLMKKAVAKINAANQATPKQEPKVSITFTETVNGKTQTVTVDETEIDDDVFPTDFDHLTKDGDLPWGWIYRNRDFTGRIQNEYSYFLHMWINSKNGSPKERYQALKSFVLYLDDAGKLCESKGECFEFWFYNDLAQKDYIEKRKSELEELTANFDELQANFDIRNNQLVDLDGRIIKMLMDNPGVLQSEFVKMFDPLVQNDFREKLYFMEKAGDLERTKSGRSYILNYTRKG